MVLSSSYKHSGVYQLFVDESQLPAADATTPLICIIGQSEHSTAPVNTLVMLSSPTEVTNTFGPKSLKQEVKGNFFIRHLQLLTEEQPVYALNVRAFDSSHKSTVTSFATAHNDELGISERNMQYATLFDRSNFWKLDAQNIADGSRGLHFSIMSSKALTIFVKRATAVSWNAYDTAAEHIAARPNVDLSFLQQDSKLLNTAVQVFAFARTFEAESMSASLQSLFDEDGNLIVNGNPNAALAALAAMPESAAIGSWTGYLFDEILDKDGQPHGIVSTINAEAKSTGLFCNVDNTVLYNAAFDGDLNSPVTLLTPNVTDIATEPVIDFTSLLSYDLASSDYGTAAHVLTYDFARSTMLATYARVANISAITIGGTAADPTAVNTDAGFAKYSTYQLIESGKRVSNKAVIFDNQSRTKTAAWAKPGATYIAANGTLGTVKSVQRAGLHYFPLELQTTELVVDPTTAQPWRKDGSGNWLYPMSWATTPGGIVQYDSNGDALVASGGALLATPSLSNALYAEYQQLYAKRIDVTILIGDKAFNGFDEAAPSTTLSVALSTDTTISVDTGKTVQVVVCRDFEDRSVVLKPFVLSGPALTSSQFSDGTAARQAEILDFIINDSGIRDGLLNVSNGFRFLTDSFVTYPVNSAKWQLAKIAEDSKRFMFFGSMPFWRQFNLSKNPYFKADINAEVDTKFIASGGNSEMPYSALFTLPQEGFGDYASAFFGPGLIVSDGRRVLLPAGPIAAAIWSRNYNSNARQPWDIAAGDTFGSVNLPSIIDVERDMTTDNRNDLEPAGFNLFLKSGTNISVHNAATSKVAVKSALSNIENVNLLHWFAAEAYLKLKALPFTRNNKETRDSAKLALDTICDMLIAYQVIEQYRNICDLTNNTDELRGAGFLIADTELVTADGIRFVLHRTTIKSKAANLTA